jgi:hypothetical protein
MLTLEPMTSIDQTALMAWLDVAAPGEQIVYHRGLLARDCSADHVRPAIGDLSLAHQIAMRAGAIRRAAQYAAGLQVTSINQVLRWRASYFDATLQRRVDLLQRRLGDRDYLYLARRR